MLTSNHINPTQYVNINLIQKEQSNQKNFEKEFQKYVEISNNQYVINPSIYLNKNISAHDISLLQSVLNKSNSTAKALKITNLNIKKGTVISSTKKNSININTNTSSQYVNFALIKRGYNGARLYWWGLTISLDNINTQMVIEDGGSVAGVLAGDGVGAIVADVPGAIGGGIIGALLSNALSAYGLNSTEAQDGSTTQINFFPAPHVQAIWAE